MPASAHAEAWALKQACYDAWHRDPQAARDAAASLARFAAGDRADPTLAALAAWTGGVAALTEGRLADALAALQGAQAGFEALGDPQHAAETQVPQIVAQAMLGRLDAAQATAESALARFVAAGDELSAGKVELNLANLLFRQDRHREAEPRFRQAALRFARVGNLELSIMADGALANTLSWQGRFDEAAGMFERARLRAEAHGLPLLRAHMHQGLGQIDLHRGHWQRALHELAEAARLVAESHAPPQRCIEAETALADAYLALNLLDEAVALYDRLIGQAAAIDAPGEQAWASLQRARALARRGDAGAALEGFDAAQRLYEQLGNRSVLALVAIARGRVELAGGNPAAARISADEALAALQGSGIVAWRLDAELLRAAALAYAGDGAAARAAFAAVRRAAAGPPALPQAAWQADAGLGQLAHAAGDLPAARAALEQALARIEQVRAALAGDELRRALGAETDGVQQALVAVALDECDSVALMLACERGRNRALALALVGDATHAPPPAADAARLQWLRQQWDQAVAEGDDARAPALAARVQALEHELMEAHRRAGLRAGAAAEATERADADAPGPGLDAADAGFDADALAVLQRTLGADRALVAFQRLDDRLLACVVTDQGVQHTVRWVPDLVAQIQALRFQIDTLRAGAALAARHGAQLLERARVRLQGLHAEVWAPLLPLLGGRTRVVVLPHRELHYLPMAALHDGRRWLVESVELTLAPSAAVWLALQQRPQPPLGPGAQALVIGAGGHGLPQVAQEVGAVATALTAAVGRRGRVEVRRDADATRAALTTGAPTADILHLACHGSFRADNPAFSYLQLADGRLTLHDAAALRLRAGLVALSACETGVSRIAPGDEVLGLVRAFLVAGAAGVLATQWPVDDASTAALVGGLYRALAGGLAPAAALRRVQAQAAAAGAHPFHWAAFALHGRG